MENKIYIFVIYIYICFAYIHANIHSHFCICSKTPSQALIQPIRVLVFPLAESAMERDATDSGLRSWVSRTRENKQLKGTVPKIITGGKKVCTLTSLPETRGLTSICAAESQQMAFGRFFWWFRGGRRAEATQRPPHGVQGLNSPLWSCYFWKWQSGVVKGGAQIFDDEPILECHFLGFWSPFRKRFHLGTAVLEPSILASGSSMYSY